MMQFTEEQLARRAEFLQNPVEQIDFMAAFPNAVDIIERQYKMGFSARDTARAAKILAEMIMDPQCSVWLTIAGSAGAAGCLNVFADMVRYNMVDAVVATGAAIVDMDFFEALGFRHYIGSPDVDNAELGDLGIDRIYDTYIDEDDLRVCDEAGAEIGASMAATHWSSQRFIAAMGKWLTEGRSKKPNSLVESAYKNGVPIFCPAFIDSSIGFGLVMDRVRRNKEGQGHFVIDPVADFYELTQAKMQAGSTGLFMVGGGVPKNFAQDTVVCADTLGHKVDRHRYAVQITVADPRDGACSSSTLKEARTWGKVDTEREQMVFAEATTVLPLIAAYAAQVTEEARKVRGQYRQQELAPTA